MIPPNTGVSAVACPRCGTALGRPDWNTAGAFCSSCRAPLQVLVFPALFRKPVSAHPAAAQEGEAVCFYHDSKRAVAPCDQCGRFLCSLCQVDLLGETWCPGCIHARRTAGQLSGLETNRILYDNAALTLAVVPLLVWPCTLVAAPMALFVAIRFWRAPAALVPRTRIRYWIAVVLASVQLGGWIWLVAFLILQR